MTLDASYNIDNIFSQCLHGRTVIKSLVVQAGKLILTAFRSAIEAYTKRATEVDLMHPFELLKTIS